MIKKRSSMNTLEQLTKPLVIVPHDKNFSQSPLKLIRQMPRQASFNLTKQHQPSPKKQDIFQQCMALVNEIKLKHQSLKGRKFFHVRSCSMPCDRVYIINELVDSLLPQSPRKQQRSLESEIQCVMRQLMEEKQQKQKAILQHDSLAKKYDQSIQQLKSHIEQYKI